MASAHTLRSFARPTAPLTAKIQPVFRASFSTTNLFANKPTKPNPNKPVTTEKMKRTYKKAPASTGPVKKPNPGERKAFRKRIQLSNNSALVVPGLSSLEADSLPQEISSGKMFAIPDDVVDKLRALEAFKATQTWNLFRKPHFLVRDEIVGLVGKMKQAGEDKTALKAILTGSKLSGKSLALLQTMSYALMNGWVVINIPEGQDLTNGNTEYSPIPDTEPMQFAQPVYCMKLLQNIYNANKTILGSLKMQKDWKLTNVKQGATLADLILSAKESDIAWPTFNALWTELTLPGRPPVLFTLDGLAHINKISDYRDPSFNQVHAHDLVLVRAFIDGLSGQKALPNGGAFIAATSENNSHHHPSQELVLAQLEAIQELAMARLENSHPELDDGQVWRGYGRAGRKIPRPDPYEKHYDERVYDALKNSEVVRLDGVKQDDARALMDYWAASGMMRSIINTNTVKEKWALGGHGIVGEMERAALMTLRM